jgi:beta-N-acetylhexosaminidase
LQGRLRDTLAFDGAVLTDDLSMAGAGVVGDTFSRVQHALQAGCDMVLVCNDRQACIDVIERLHYDDNPISQLRRTRLHGRAQIGWDDLHALDEWQFVSDAVARLDFAPELGL